MAIEPSAMRSRVLVPSAVGHRSLVAQCHLAHAGDQSSGASFDVQITALLRRAARSARFGCEIEGSVPAPSATRRTPDSGLASDGPAEMGLDPLLNHVICRRRRDVVRSARSIRRHAGATGAGHRDCCGRHAAATGAGGGRRRARLIRAVADRDRVASDHPRCRDRD